MLHVTNEEAGGGRWPSLLAAPDTSAASTPLPLDEALVEMPAFYPHVKVAAGPGELPAIGRLRHREFVARQGKRYGSIAPEPDCLLEPQDLTEVNIYAVDVSGMTAALRVGPLEGSRHANAEQFHAVARMLAIDPRRTIICSRLVRDPRHSGRHAVDLIGFNRLRTVGAGWRYCLMQTTEHHRGFFEKLDFIRSGFCSDDHIAGRLETMVLDTQDEPVRLRRPKCLGVRHEELPA